MSFLDQLTQDQQQLLTELPYRVGLWVSQSDIEGGAQSDAKELQALSNILGGYAGEVFVSETVQYIITETLKHQNDWPQWGTSLDRTPQDCRHAIKVLSDAVDVKEVNAFKQHLMEVGEAVALAFRERESRSFLARIKSKIEYRQRRYRAQKNGQAYKNFEEFLNISTQERKALEALSQALNIQYAI